MGARRLGTTFAAAMLWACAVQAQSGGSGTNTGSGSTGSSSGTGTSTGSAGSSQQGGAMGSGGGVTFDPAAQAAARLFGIYRVPGAAPLDTSGVYRVDTGSSPPAAGSGGSGAGSTGTTATTNTSTSGSTTTGGAPTSTP